METVINLSNMMTEARNEKTMKLDRMSALEIATVMNQADHQVLQGIQQALPQIAQAISWIEQAFYAGGRLFYTGAGTSGRLGVLDASECPPTFGVDPGQVVGLIAGGDVALRNPVEGAEDSEEMGRQDLLEHQLTQHDIVVGIAASGRTPYTIGCLTYANQLGCRTISVTCNESSKMAQIAQLAIEVLVGSEVLTGSTRLKSGTAQKMVLNMLSTGAMVRTGKAYQNLMVDVVQSNQKLKVRAENIIMEATGVTREAARQTLDRADNHVKTAIVMILTNCDKQSAQDRLDKAKGHVSQTLDG